MEKEAKAELAAQGDAIDPATNEPWVREIPLSKRNV